MTCTTCIIRDAAQAAKKSVTSTKEECKNALAAAAGTAGAAAAKAIATEHIACACCGVKQPPTAFAKGQLRTNKSSATCLACTATSAAAKRVDTAQCAKCGLEKSKS